ncbi:hypothetical protein D3C87_586890 [compost metagenome]
MFMFDEKARGQAYILSILLSTMLIRIVLGLAYPNLSMEQTALIGVTTVLLLGPPIYQWLFDKPMIKPSKRIQYRILSTLAVGMFIATIIL